MADRSHELQTAGDGLGRKVFIAREGGEWFGLGLGVPKWPAFF